MATKVNVKFVILLAVALAVLFGGVATIAYFKLTTSGEEYEAKGDALVAVGDFDEAADMYRAASRHDPTNIVWLTKWRDTILKVIPETQVEYLKYYQEYYLGILRQLAALQDTDPTPQRAYLEPYYRQLRRGGATAESWQRLIDQVNTMLQRLPEDDPVTKQIHRYRGLAGIARMEQIEERDSEREQSLADLQVALEGDPNDVESVVGIMKWRFNEWKRAHRMRRNQTADQLWIELMQEVAAAREAFPDAPAVLLTELQIAVERVLQIEEAPGIRVQMIQRLTGAEQPVLEALRNAPPESIDEPLLRSVYAMIRPVRPQNYAEDMLPILDRVVEAKPYDAGIKLLRADALSDLNRQEEAIAQFQAVAEMPNLPVSLDGLLLIGNQRFTAMYGLSDMKLDQRETTADADQQQALLDDAVQYRDELAAQIPGGEGSPIVMLLDGRIAMAEGRYGDAIERLKALDDRVGGRDPEVIKLLGRALLASNILGAGKEQFERLVEIVPGDIQSLFVLADIETRLQNFDAAIERYDEILALAPSLEEAQVRRAAVLAETGVTSVAQTGNVDPVRVALIRWRALMQQEDPEPDEAYAILREARRDHGDSPLLLNAMITHVNQEGNAEDALRLTQDAIALYPDNPRFNDWLTRLELQSQDISFDQRLEIVESSTDDPVDRLLKRAALLRSAGRVEESQAAFDEAVALNPEHPEVIEAQFSRAATSGEFDRARTIAATAARLNLDSVNGLLFQSRLEFAQGDYQKSLATLRQVIERLPYDPLALRLLGQTYLALGRANDAIDALSQAFNYKPDGVLVARLYVQALIRLQRNEEALAVVKQARRYNGADPFLREQWLNLEELVGDIDLALAERIKRYEKEPSDIDNASGMIRMYLNAENWAAAHDAIEAMRAANPENADLALLEANWHARQGDIEAGGDVLRANIAADDGLEPRVQLARYYADLNAFDRAIAELMAAQALQGSDERVVELLLADLYFRMGDYASSLPLFETAISAGVENDQGDVTRRYADALLRLERYQQAEEALMTLRGDARNNTRTNIFLARAAAGKGDDRAAMVHLDAAVAAAPNNPEPFVERASFNARRGQQLEAVLQDLNQAIQLAPSSVPARQLKANVLIQNNRLAEASRELQDAVRNNPENGDLRMLLIRTLTNMGQAGQAIVAATEASRQFPDEPGWLLTAGDLHAREGRWDQALNNYLRAYTIENDSQIAVRVGQAFLEVDPPRYQDAIDLLDTHRDDTERLSTILLLQSQAHAGLGNTSIAMQLASQSFDMSTKPADVRDWFTGLNRLIEDRHERLAFVRNLNPPQNLDAIYTVLLARMEAQDLELHDSVIAKLQSIEDTDMDDPTRTDLYRILGGLLYFKEQYVEAAEIFQKAVAIAPNDLEFNNNLAYLMARYLNDAQGALQPAEKAAQLSPTDPNVLDTLGWVYFQLGRLSQAQATLNQALENANTPAERIPAYLHLAETNLAQNAPDSMSRALRNANAARELIDRSPALKQTFQGQLDSVMAKLNPSE